jgi:hypothetical protein
LSTTGKRIGISKGRGVTIKHGRYVGLRKLAREHGVSAQFLVKRINSGYTLEQALAVPKHARRPARQTLVAISIQAVLRSWGRA